MAPIQVAIIIPAFNEGRSIGNVIEELIATVGKYVIPVVVNDCSSDDTANVALKAGATVVDLQKNHGYAQAINQGLKYACSELDVDYLLTMDADGQHEPVSVQLLIESMITDEQDLIVGRRPKTARFSEWLYGKYFSLRFSIADPLCGLKIYKKVIYQEYETFETYDSIGTELLTWTLLKGFKVSQQSINIRDRLDAPRFGSTFAANKRIFFSLMHTIIYIKRRERNNTQSS
jgi:glycosyltransferase involved in cell wall biosynthesis